MKQPAIFLDRDGTMIEEVNYLHRVEDLRLFPSTEDALRDLKSAGFLVIVVTNQSGIGRGIYSENDMHSIHDAIRDEIPGAVDAFYFCPHIPDGDCECRKPRLGMIKAACRDFEIDMKRSWMIGDKKIDVETAQNAGLSSALVLTGYGREHAGTLEQAADITADDLGSAAGMILKREKIS